MMDTNDDMDEDNLYNKEKKEKDQGQDKREEEHKGEEREKDDDQEMEDAPKEPTQTSILTILFMAPPQGEHPIASTIHLDPRVVI